LIAENKTKGYCCCLVAGCCPQLLSPILSALLLRGKRARKTTHFRPRRDFKKGRFGVVVVGQGGHGGREDVFFSFFKSIKKTSSLPKRKKVLQFTRNKKN
jgi:hypothetical protein